MLHKVSFLSMCPCGQHGRFVLPDETYGHEFCSKLDARAEIDRLFAEKKILADEKKFLNSQISEQEELAPSKELAGMRARLKCEILNQLEEMIEREACLDEGGQHTDEVVH